MKNWFKRVRIKRKVVPAVTMHLQPVPYHKIESGSKKIEIRINDNKRRQLRVGDRVEFVLRGSVPTKKLTKTIVGLHQFATFAELFAKFPEQGDPSLMYQYYPLEEEQRYGVVGIELD